MPKGLTTERHIQEIERRTCSSGKGSCGNFNFTAAGPSVTQYKLSCSESCSNLLYNLTLLTCSQPGATLDPMACTSYEDAQLVPDLGPDMHPFPHHIPASAFSHSVPEFCFGWIWYFQTPLSPLCIKRDSEQLWGRGLT